MRTKSVSIFILFVAMVIATSFVPQTGGQTSLDSIVEAIKAGNSSELSKHLNPTVELEILQEENIYSKAQAELLLKDFFNRNKPSAFKINHQGTKGATSFAIGILTTSTGNFRVSIFMKSDNDKMLIHQLRIERSDEAVKR